MSDEYYGPCLDPLVSKTLGKDVAGLASRVGGIKEGSCGNLGFGEIRIQGLGSGPWSLECWGFTVQSLGCT